jgi:Ankyrin repeats (3 copies)
MTNDPTGDPRLGRGWIMAAWCAFAAAACVCILLVLAKADWNQPGGLWLKNVAAYLKFLCVIGIAAIGVLCSAIGFIRSSGNRHAGMAVLANTTIFLFAAIVWYWPTGDTLLRAARNGDLTTARNALLLGVDPNSVDVTGFYNSASESALSLAAAGNHLDVVSLLVDRGATVQEARSESNALMAAAGAGNIDVVKYLC